jgi:hypothetical protein
MLGLLRSIKEFLWVPECRDRIEKKLCRKKYRGATPPEEVEEARGKTITTMLVCEKKYIYKIF